MEKFIRYSFAAGFFLLVISCKTTQPLVKENPDQYFQVSLYSIGTGIDHEADAIVINTIEKYKKKGYPFDHVMTHWGKEGEKHYCIYGQKLSSNQYKEILDEMKSLLKDRLVHVREKQGCPEQ